MLLLSAGGVDESTGYPGSVQLLPSRALIPHRKAGLARHDENCGTTSSNPHPSTGEAHEPRAPKDWDVRSFTNCCWADPSP